MNDDNNEKRDEPKPIINDVVPPQQEEVTDVQAPEVVNETASADTPQEASPAIAPAQESQPINHEPTPHVTEAPKKPTTIIVACFVVLALLIGVAGYVLMNREDPEPKTAQSTQPTTTAPAQPVNDLKDEGNGKYSSVLDKFSVKLPGIPEVSKQTIQVDKSQVPVSTYAYQTTTTPASTYIIGVYDYTGLSLAQTALDNSIDGAVKSISGAVLKSKTPTKYGGLPAIDAVIEIPNNPKPTTARVMLNGTKAYALFLINGDKKDFDTFANSLEFTR